MRRKSADDAADVHRRRDRRARICSGRFPRRTSRASRAGHRSAQARLGQPRRDERHARARDEDRLARVRVRHGEGRGAGAVLPALRAASRRCRCDPRRSWRSSAASRRSSATCGRSISKFGKGGKGVATAAGVFLALAPMQTLLTLVDLRRRRAAGERIRVARHRSTSASMLPVLLGDHGRRALAAVRRSASLVARVRVLDASREHRAAAQRRRASLRQARRREAPARHRDRRIVLATSWREVRLMRCAVIGAGAWGTALADLLADNGHDTVLWAFEPDVVDVDQRARTRTALSRRRCRCAPALRATTTIAEALDGAELVVYATPSHHLRRDRAAGRARASRAARCSPSRARASSATTLALMTTVVDDEVPRPSRRRHLRAELRRRSRRAASRRRSSRRRRRCAAARSRAGGAQQLARFASTRTTTSSASSSAARSRTSWRSRRASSKAWGSASTRARRSSRAGCTR